jgi:hypothetical protein
MLRSAWGNDAAVEKWNPSGRNEGKLEVGIFPTDAAGKVLPPEDVLTDANELIGKPLRFVLRVSSVGLPFGTRFEQVPF